MATKKITISVSEEMARLFDAGAAQAGMANSPYVARAAMREVLREDAARIAAKDRGRDHLADAEAQLTEQLAAESAAREQRGHAA